MMFRISPIAGIELSAIARGRATILNCVADPSFGDRSSQFSDASSMNLIVGAMRSVTKRRPQALGVTVAFHVNGLGSIAEVMQRLDALIERSSANVYYVRTTVPLRGAPGASGAGCAAAVGKRGDERRGSGAGSGAAGGKPHRRRAAPVEDIRPTPIIEGRVCEAAGMVGPHGGAYAIDTMCYVDAADVGRDLPYLLLRFRDRPPAYVSADPSPDDAREAASRAHRVPLARMIVHGESEEDLVAKLHDAMTPMQSRAPMAVPEVPAVRGAPVAPTRPIGGSEWMPSIDDVVSFYMDPIACIWTWSAMQQRGAGTHIEAADWPIEEWTRSQRPIMTDALHRLPTYVSMVRYVLTIPPIPIERSLLAQYHVEEEIIPNAHDVICHLDREPRTGGRGGDELFDKLLSVVGEIVIDPETPDSISFAYGALADAGQVFDYGECAELADRLWT